jgi:hypothetical protein
MCKRKSIAIMSKHTCINMATMATDVDNKALVRKRTMHELSAQVHKLSNSHHAQAHKLFISHSCASTQAILSNLCASTQALLFLYCLMLDGDGDNTTAATISYVGIKSLMPRHTSFILHCVCCLMTTTYDYAGNKLSCASAQASFCIVCCRSMTTTVGI